VTAPSVGQTPVHNVNNTAESFLASAHPWWVPPVEDLAFSGLYNSVVGAVVDANTPVVNSSAGSPGTYGTYMRFEGTVQLTNGQLITIAHDGGVSLWIDGVRAPGFFDGIGSRLEYGLFAGLTGLHKIELIYANSHGSGILCFSPEM
jgi:hypothetical protein